MWVTNIETSKLYPCSCEACVEIFEKDHLTWPLFPGNHYVKLDGAGHVLLISSPNFKCSNLASTSKIGFAYKLANAQVGVGF